MEETQQKRIEKQEITTIIIATLFKSSTKKSINYYFKLILGASSAFKRAFTSAQFLSSSSLQLFINQVGQNRRTKLIHQPMESIQVPPLWHCLFMHFQFEIVLYPYFYFLQAL